MGFNNLTFSSFSFVGFSYTKPDSVTVLIIIDHPVVLSSNAAISTYISGLAF